MGLLTDTHCHLDFDAFEEDRVEVISRAVESGLVRMLNPGIDLATSKAAVTLARTNSEICAAVGIHPNSATTWDENSLKDLQALSQDPRVVAIGEIGLDYYRDRTPRDLQKIVLKKQLSLAVEQALPVVIHNREASDDILEILGDWQFNLVESGSSISDRPGVLHSFSGNSDHAAKALKHNFFIGITGPVTFKKALDLQNLVTDIPIESILIETDSPFLTPHPRRGKRNEPANVQWIALKIAELKGMDVQLVRQKTSENAARLFEW